MNFTSVFSNINSKEVLKNLPDAVLVVEADGKILWGNEKAASMFQTKEKTLTCYFLDEIVAEGISMADQSSTKKSSVVTGAFTVEGEEIFVELSAKKFADQFFITIRDITSLTGILSDAEKTSRMNKEKNTMLAKLSNEIKSPLQAMLGFSQALLDRENGELNEKQDKYLNIINKNSGELLFFMDKLIEFSQAESTFFKPNFHVFDVVNAIQTVMKNNETQMYSKKLEFEFDHEEITPKAIFSDEEYVKIIVQNLIETTIRLADSGNITIKLKYPELEQIQKRGIKVDELYTTNKYIQISVNDVGMGLSSADMEGIFEPYGQLDKVNKKGVLRSINLGTVYTLAKKLQGDAWVESGVMRGTVFNVILPIDKEQRLEDE